MTKCIETLNATKEKLISEGKQTLDKLEKHKVQYLNALNTKIETVKSRMVYEEREIGKQLAADQ